MSRFHAGWKGGRAPYEMTGNLRALATDVIGAADRAVPTLALMLVRQIKVLLSTPGQGRIYGRGTNTRRTVIHIASAPGDPPAVDTGQLRNSIDMEPVEGSGLVTSFLTRARRAQSYRVGTNVEYAPWLEFGTTGSDPDASDGGSPYAGGRVAPRPFLRPAVRLVQRAWTSTLIGVLRHAGSRGR